MQLKRTSMEVVFHNPNQERDMVQFLLFRIAEDLIGRLEKTTAWTREGEEIEDCSLLSGIDGQDRSNQ